MGLFDNLKSLISSDKLNVEARFELLTAAVTGTMSRFHMARDKKTKEVFGLKLLDAEKTEAFEQRFRGLSKPAEGEIAMQIEHPRVVKTIGHGMTTKGERYILMEFIEGTVLSSLILERSEKLEGKRLKLIRQMAEAVAAVHDADVTHEDGKHGFIHRDICPRNFIASKEVDSVKLIDFGLSVPKTQKFMQPGNRTGTAAYLSPEIVRRKWTDERVDIFSLGVSAYYLCAFEFPWPGGEATGKVALRHDTQPAVDILECVPNLNQKLGQTIMQCIAIDPADRPTAEKLVRTLRLLKGDDEPS